MSAPSSTPLPRRARLAIPVVLAGLAMLGPFSIDTPFPAFAAMRSEFGAGPGAMQLVVSAYLFAFAVMSVLHGPLSDAVGRRPVMAAGVGVYAVASLGGALAPSLPVLLVFRVLQGLSAGGGVVVSRTIIRDLFEGAQAQRLMSRVAMIFGLGPAIAPVIGGLLLQIGPWPGIFAFLAVVGVVLLGAVVLVLPETHPPQRRRALSVRGVLGDLVAVGRTRDLRRVSWVAALAFGGQFLYIGAAAIFIVDLLHRGELDFWMFFAPMVSGVVLGSWVSGRVAGRIDARRVATAGLTFATVAALAGIVIARSSVGTALPYAVLGPSLISFGVAIAYPTLQLTILDLAPTRRGSAASLSTFIQLMLNSVTSAVVVPLVTDSVATLATAAAAFVTAGLALWLRHLRRDRHTVVVPRHPEDLEPTDRM